MVTMATIHLLIQIRLFLFIPQVTYVHTKIEGGLFFFYFLFFSFLTLLHLLGELLVASLHQLHLFCFFLVSFVLFCFVFFFLGGGGWCLFVCLFSEMIRVYFFMFSLIFKNLILHIFLITMIGIPCS